MVTFRYILREFFWPFVVVLVCITLLMFLSQLFRLGGIAMASLQAGEAFLRLFVYVLPSFLVFTIPGSLLLAGLVAFDRLAQDGELTAWLAAGRHPARLLTAPLLVAAAMCAVLFGLTLYGEAWGARRFREDMADLAKETLISSLKPQVFHDNIPGMMIYFLERGADGALGHVMLFDKRDPETQDLVVAERGTVAYYEHDHSLRFTLANGEIHRQGQDSASYVHARFEEATLTFDVDQWVRSMTSYFHGFFAFDLDTLRAEIARYVTKDPAHHQKLLVHFHKKFAFPVTCVLFTLVGLSLGQRREAMRRSLGYVLGVLVAIGYHGLIRAGENLAVVSPNAPVWPIVWAPTVVVVITLLVIRRVWMR